METSHQRLDVQEADRPLPVAAADDPAPDLGPLLDPVLDGFKPINDRYGHAAGDTLLITVADRLRGAVPSDALVARLGGDEFAVLCPASSPTLAHRLADDLHATLLRAIELDGHTVEVGASVGLVTTSMLAGSPVTSDGLLSAADTAMFEAKRDPERPVPGLRTRRRAGTAPAPR